MKSLFDKTQFAGIGLKNRFVRSATYDGYSDKEGHVTEDLIKVYEGLAKGGVGAIITGLAHITDTERDIPMQMGIYNDSFIDEYKILTEKVHKYDSKIFIQLASIGTQTTSAENKVMYGPSSVEDSPYKNTPKEMTKEDIESIKNSFADAALRSKKSGFDGVQLHVAHGYLLSKFLTPYFNHRSDEYGGNIENRARIIFETYKLVRETVGEIFPILIKINCSDFMDDGFTFDECKYVCEKLAELGIDGIEISGGLLSSKRNQGTIRRKIKKDQESYFLPYAAEIAKEIKVPVILVGGNRDYHSLSKIIKETDIEYISFSRPLICEPDLIKRWEEKDYTPSKCISCNKCFTPKGTKCIFNK